MSLSISKFLSLKTVLAIVFIMPTEMFPALAEEPRSNIVYENNVNKIKTNWERLTPNIGVLQWAGDIGVVSAGLGWDYGRNNHFETLILAGYLPKWSFEHRTLTFTVKENWIPFRIGSDNISYKPLVLTAYMNSIFNDEFWTKEPDRYPSGYYWFSSRMRLAVGAGQRLSFDIPYEHRRLHDTASLYYELSATDFYLISAVRNKSIRITDIIHLGIGIQYTFF